MTALTASTSRAAARRPTCVALAAIARLYPAPSARRPRAAPEAQDQAHDPERGRPLTPQEVRQERAAAFVREHGLSGRCVEVVQRAAAGQSNREMGQAMFLSENTIKMHLRRTFARIGARDRAHAATIMLRAGLVAAPVVAADLAGRITAREGQTLALVANGHSNAEAAAILGNVSPLTVKSCLERVARKVGTGDRAAMAAAAYAAGIVR